MNENRVLMVWILSPMGILVENHDKAIIPEFYQDALHYLQMYWQIVPQHRY